MMSAASSFNDVPQHNMLCIWGTTISEDELEIKIEYENGLAASIRSI